MHPRPTPMKFGAILCDQQALVVSSRADFLDVRVKQSRFRPVTVVFWSSNICYYGMVRETILLYLVLHWQCYIYIRMGHLIPAVILFIHSTYIA